MEESQNYYIGFLFPLKNERMSIRGIMLFLISTFWKLNVIGKRKSNGEKQYNDKL